MRTSPFSFPVAQFAEEPIVTKIVSITVDPLVPDEMKRESTSGPIVREMQRQKFPSDEAADNFFQTLMMRKFYSRQSAMQQMEPQDTAKMLVADALVTRDTDNFLDIATRALELDEKCAEAYILLSRAETRLPEKLQLLQAGMELAVQELDSSRFEKPDGYFWQRLATRPYMRCRTALATTLWDSGAKQDAIEHFKALLNLNPYDNQGLRYHLVNWLVDVDPTNSDADKYCDEYETDPSAFVKYACLLRQFAQGGKCKASSAVLTKAIESNKYVPAILCGKANFPKLQSSRVQRGTPQEAIAYHRAAYSAWQNFPGALEWLARNCSTLVSSKTILRHIESAQEFIPTGNWVQPAPMEAMGAE